MRKIYSLVLMAAALLVGTNAWAATHYINNGTATAIQTAINDAANTGDVIVLNTDVTMTAGDKIWLGTACIGDTPKSITLDMNGYSITKAAENGKSEYFFVITHGELKVVNNGSQVSVIGYSGGSTGDKAYGTQIFSVYGSYKSSRWNADGNALNPDSINTRTSGYFSHLVIGERVQIMLPAGCLGTAISVDVIAKGTTSIPYQASNGAIKYFTAIDAKKGSDGKYGGYGYAYGARVDLYGEIYSLGGTSGSQKAYGIKANGNLESTLSGNGLWSDWATEAAKTQYNGCMSNTDSYLQNYNTASHKPDTLDAPFVHVHSTAKIITSSGSTKSAAIYASGYAKWMIEGHCEGNIGIYASSGEIALQDATITSTAESYAAPNGGGGVSGSGSAIVVNSRDAYAGGTSVNITGDTEVSATSGYAIEETVTTSDDGSKTVEISISGGTIEGGNQGAIAVTTTKTDSEDPTKEVSVTTVYSGNVTGSIVDNSGDTPTTTSLESLLPTETHVTTVYDENGGNPVQVVSPGTADPTPESWVHGSAEDASVNWTGDEDELNLTNTPSKKLKLAELEINKVSGTTPQDQTLIVRSGITLEAGKVILGPKAVIEVEPGAKLIVTGEEGIYSRKITNLVLKATATQQATFVIGPNVSSNRQPCATVEYTPTTYMMANGTKVWQRFTSPLDKVTENPSNNASTLEPIAYVTGSTLLTYASYYDGATGWVNLTKWKQLRSFRASAIANNTPENTNVTYTFKGKLAGNVTDSIAFWNSGWNYYGNSYIAPMSTKSLIAALDTARRHGIDVDGTLQLWNVTNQSYTPLNTVSSLFGKADVEVPALQCFVIKLRSGNFADFDINYGKTVYDYAIHPSNYALSAPARLNSGTSTVRINIESANGMKDAICIVESDIYSADYDESADAEKIVVDGLNFYVADENTNLGILASDDILGSLLTLQTADEIDYTLSFDYVRGEVYALRDNMTNAVVLMNEGAIYSFTAQPNATLEGRFQIVSRQEMPTAVETVEETINAPKAIYTVMGQYVGETTDWNNLPAGVYVVDGVKVIK